MKNPEANDTNWFTIIFSAGCAIMSNFMDNHLFRKIILALMILSFIYTTIKNLKITLYGIKPKMLMFVHGLASKWIIGLFLLKI